MLDWITKFATGVTRFGEFSPLELLLSLCNFVKTTKLEQMQGQFFSPKSYVIKLGNKRFGLHFGRFFFTTASGHPVWHSF
jgi:hypothetical protein